MAITFDEKNGIFHIKTKTSSYIFKVLQGKELNHLYYGKRIDDISGIENAQQNTMYGFNAATSYLDDKVSNGSFAREYSTYGNSDFRKPSLCVKHSDCSEITELLYKGYEIYNGKKSLCGLPSVYTENDNEAQTLEITLYDSLKDLKVVLVYTAFDELDAITRSVRIENHGNDVNLKSALSMMMDFNYANFDFVHLHGQWANERMIERIPVANCKIEIDSARGASSHFHSPFFALCSKDANENNGDVYGFSFVYSGNFVAGTESSNEYTIRAYMGINPFGFDWLLKNGETFTTPEVVMVYSDNGFNKMSQIFHKLYRTRLCRGYWRDKERPVLINNWEATYFNFDEEMICDIAKSAKELGVELMVLDDGWFGKRDEETTSLGDWYPDKNKLPNGIKGLCKKINEMGLKFGLWFEPEMVSPDSDLFRAHPDWCLHVEGRKSSLGRNQLVLDLTRAEVRDYIVDSMSKIFDEANVEYVKWDFNRNLTECASATLAPELQGQVFHRYVLGLYEILDRLTKKYPKILFEGCSGGGGRFDAGQIAYFSQYWTSDDTDAVERLKIQYGTSLVMPAITMGAHVSAVPNHQVGRVTPIDMRANVAMSGQFGYELDLGKLSDEEKQKVKLQIEKYKQIREIVHTGTMYRLSSPFENNNTDWMFVTEDKSRFVYFHHIVHGKPSADYYSVKLCGIDESELYAEEGTDKVYSGSLLTNLGLTQIDNKDCFSEVRVFQKVDK